MKESYEIISIYYYPDLNYFTDENGEVIYNMYEFVTPSQLYLMKIKRGYFYIDDPTNKDIKYEIVCPMDEDYYDAFDSCDDWIEIIRDPWRSYAYT